MLFPLWLANFAVKKATGGEIVPYDEFIKETEKPQDSGKMTSKKKEITAEEIEQEFAPIIAADALKGIK